MSRHIVKSQDNRYVIAYGYDRMIPNPGYFVQVFDKAESYDHDEGLIRNEGYFNGLSSDKMSETMAEIIKTYDISYDEENQVLINNLLLIALNELI